MSGTVSDIRIVDMPDLGSVTSASSVVAEQSGSGRFAINALRNYINSGTMPGITPQQYGAVADGTTDCTTAIKNMLAANPTGIFDFPPGNYAVSSTITIGTGQFLRGTGPGSTRFLVTVPTGDIFSMTSGGGLLNGCGMAGFSISASVTRTAGRYIVDATNCMSLIDNFTLEGAFIGIELSGTATYVTRGQIRDCTAATGIALRISGGGDHYLMHLIFDNPTADPFAGLEIVQSGGSFVSDCDFIRCGTGIFIAPGQGQIVEWCSFSQVDTDTCKLNGLRIETAPGSNGLVYGLAFQNFWASSAASDGILISGGGSWVDGLNFTNLRCVNNAHSGVIILNAAKNIQFTGGQISGNSTAAAFTYSGIDIGANVTSVRVAGMRIGAMGPFADIHAAGIKIEAGSGDDFIIAENDLSTTGTPLTNAATGTSVIISNNMGYRMRAKGPGTIAIGATSVAINHGMQVTPARSDVMVTPETDPAVSGITRWWVSATTSLSFTVSVDTAATNVFYFGWSVQV